MGFLARWTNKDELFQFRKFFITNKGSFHLFGQFLKLEAIYSEDPFTLKLTKLEKTAL